jgi:hypothetical protein
MLANDEIISTTEPNIHVRYPAGLRNFSRSTMSRPTPESTHSPMQCVSEVILLAVKMLWHEDDQSPTSSARALNETMLYFHHNFHHPQNYPSWTAEDNFTFSFFPMFCNK